MDYPNELVKVLGNIKTAISNIGSDSPETIEYPEELPTYECGALKKICEAIKDGNIAHNYVEVIHGTGNKPWGDISPTDFAKLVQDAYEQNCTVKIDIDTGSDNHFIFNCVPYPDPLTHDDAFVGVMANFRGLGDEIYLEVAGEVMWLGGYLFMAIMYNYDTTPNIINMTDMVAGMPCTVTIYHHPM